MEEEIQYCKSPLLDPTLFPVGSANFLNSNYNVLPFLCNLLQVANDETISPVLVEQPDFDISPFTDFSGLLGVGDSRISLGKMMSATFIHFLPKIIAQTEVLQAGGTQVIDNYICDADGNTIKQSQTIPILLSLDLTGQSSYKFGALEIPPITDSVEELLKRFTPEDVKSFVNSYFTESTKEHAIYFVNFINTYFTPAGWTVSLKHQAMVDIFYVELSLGSSKKTFLKYHNDVKETVAKLFEIDTITSYPFTSNTSSMAHAKAMSGKIEDYKTIMEDDVKRMELIDYIKNNYIEDSSQVFSGFASNSAISIEQIKEMQKQFTTASQAVSTIKVDFSKVN